MDSNNTTTITLKVNGDEAKSKISNLLDQLTTMRQRLGELSRIPVVNLTNDQKKEIKDLTRDIKQTQRELNRMQSSAQAADRVLGQISSANLKELKTTLRDLNRELNSGDVQRGSERWNQLAAKARDIKAEIEKVNQEFKATKELNKDNDSGKSWVQRFGEKWSGFVVTIQGVKDTLSRITSTAMDYYQEYAQMAEHMSNVKKYTGLADEAVKQLNEDFKRMDTRTSREQLNDLAADAGRLGIQSRQQILDFVQAADQLNVALGEDLGEDGVKNIGKLAQLFGDADRMGLKQAMLATGSVINELAQSSSASEPYLMDFTARLAGVSKQARLTQAQVLAFGSILDQSMVGVEKGATALQNVIVALYANPAKMAKAAGLEVKQFTELLKTDGNAALLKFVEGLQKAGGMDSLAPLLKELNLSGSGVTQTLSALANNLRNLKQTQAQATTAFQQATSVTNEFNTANNTVQARLDKARKAATDMAVTLGEQLAPVAERILTTSTYFMSVLSTLATFIARNAKQIVIITANIAAYTIAIQSAAIKTLMVATYTKAAAAATVLWNGAISIAKSLSLSLSMAYSALTGNVTRLRAAQVLLNRTLIANHYVAVATAAIAAASAMFLWFTRERELTDEQKKRRAIEQDNLQLQQRGNAAIASTQAKITLLTAIIHDNNRKLSDRQAAVNALRRIVPGYNALIDKEGRITRENTAAVKDYIQQLKNKAIVEAAQEKLKQIAAQQIQRTDDRGRYENAVSLKQQRLATFEQQNKDFIKLYQDLQKEARQGSQAAWQALGTLMRSSKYKEYNHLKTDIDTAKTWIAGADRDLNGLDAQSRNLLKTVQKLGGTLDQVLNLDAPTGGQTTSSPAVTTEGAATGGGTNSHTNDNSAALAALERKKYEQEQKAAMQYVTGEIKSYQLYKERLLDIDNEFLNDKKKLYKAGDSELNNIERQLQENQQRDVREQTDWSLQQIDIEAKAEQTALAEKYAKNQLTSEQYQRELEALEERTLERRVKFLKDPRNGAQPEALYQAEQALTQKRDANQLAQLQRLQQQANQVRQEYLQKSIDEQEQDELRLLEYLKEQGAISEEEKQKAKLAIAEKYAKKRKEKEADPDDSTDQKDDPSPLTGSTDAMSTAVINFANVFKQLQDRIEDGKATWQDYAAAGVAAVAIVTATMSSASQLVQANQQLEEARITKRYDAEIKAAGNNTKKTKKLEEQKQAELAKVKTKYNKKAMKIEIAQAVAQMATNAIIAYGQGLKVNVFFGPIAAAMALAAGAIQIASIKKQHQAQAEGYYTGGFTPGRNYRQAAGIVHQGEFVANHQAVNNPAILPVLQLIDQAQRTNRVASLTPADVSRAIIAPQTTAAATLQTATATQQTAAAAPSLQIINTTTDRQTETLDRLTAQLDRGITATVTLDGPNGLDRQYKRYQRLNNV